MTHYSLTVLPRNGYACEIPIPNRTSELEQMRESQTRFMFVQTRLPRQMFSMHSVTTVSNTRYVYQRSIENNPRASQTTRMAPSFPLSLRHGWIRANASCPVRSQVAPEERYSTHSSIYCFHDGATKEIRHPQGFLSASPTLPFVNSPMLYRAHTLGACHPSCALEMKRVSPALWAPMLVSG